MQHLKKVVLTGVNGQVGYVLKQKLEQDNQLILFSLTREQLDLSNQNEIRRIIREIKPDIIINPAAYTAVDKAESEPDLAFAINAEAPRVLAEEAAKLNGLLVHYSTDYVFDGSKLSPYVEEDETNPLGVYGKSKLAGEQAIRDVGAAHLIFRTSWVYGAYGKNFFNTILRLASEHASLRIVGDQFGAPTSSLSIADATIHVLNRMDAPNQANLFGLYHMTNTGKTSWYGFANEIVVQYAQLAKSNTLPPLKAGASNIASITTAEYPTPAIRPKNSSLDLSKLNQTFGIQLPPWQDALADIINVAHRK